jgi:hypothetical protein
MTRVPFRLAHVADTDTGYSKLWDRHHLGSKPESNWSPAEFALCTHLDREYPVLSLQPTPDADPHPDGSDRHSPGDSDL